jgi:hypothetical protein
MNKPNDSVYRRIVIEYGQVYAYAYYLNENGKILAEECWQQPFKLERRDVQEEAGDTWDLVYQHLQDTVLWSASDVERPGMMGEDPEV